MLEKIPVPSGFKNCLGAAEIQSAFSVVPPETLFFPSELSFPHGAPKNTDITLERANCIQKLGRPPGGREKAYGRRFDPRINDPAECQYCYFSQKKNRACLIKGPTQLSLFE